MLILVGKIIAFAVFPSGRHPAPDASYRQFYLAFSLLALGLLAGCGKPMAEDIPARLAVRGETIPLITARDYPISIQPIPGLKSCVTDEQLLITLNASLPWWHPPSVPSLIHELKLWGRDAVFSKEQVGGEGRSGHLILATLLSDSLCRQNTVILGDGDGGPYLIDSAYGIHPIQSGTYDAVEYRAETHFGKLMMLMGLANVPLSTPVTAASGQVGTLANLLQDTIMNFGWHQELEFAGCALAYWLPPETSWSNQFGEIFTFNELMDRLLAMPLGNGCCAGTHVLYTVVTLLRVDEQIPILDRHIRAKAESRLIQVARLLEKTQNPDGTWPRDWGATGEDGFLYGDIILDNITIAGHHLEWIALAREEHRPSKDSIMSAVSSVVEQVNLLPPIGRRSFKTILPCSHAAKAMCLMRDVDPYLIWLELSNASLEGKE